MIKNLIATLLAFVILLAIAFAIYSHHQAPIPVVIQAGHEGRSSGNTGASYKGTQEVKWNIAVANKAANKLRSWGIDVKRVDANASRLRAKIAVAIHFDGAKKPCSSGASIGYSNKASKELAKRWKQVYKKYFPFRWHKDNFTKELSHYYAYKKIEADKFLVLELGEIDCPKQVKWLKPRLNTIAILIAATIAKEFGLNPRVDLKKP